MEYIGFINLLIKIYLTIDKEIYHMSRIEKKFGTINLRLEYISGVQIVRTHVIHVMNICHYRIN